MLRRRAARLDILVSFTCLGLLGYMSWHIYVGPRGVTYRDKLEAQISSLQQKLQSTEQDRQALDKRARLLRPESVDPDMVEELARSGLAMARPNDLIIRLKD